MESFWHVLLWIALRHCDHRMSGMKLADALGSLFDHKYIGENGQAYSGGSKEDSLKSRSHIRHMELASEVLRTILVNTAQVLAIRYPNSEDQDGILEVQRMWENLQQKSSALDKEDLLITQLGHRIVEMGNKALLSSYLSWKNQRTPMDAEWMDSADECVLRVQQMWKAIESEYSQFRTTDILLQRMRYDASRAQLAIAHDLWEKGRTMQDDAEWMEKIFENALKDPRVDWNTGSDNIQRVLLRPSA